MTIEQFNALPLEARRYIESQKSCLSCRGLKNLDLHYKNYLKMKNETLFTLRRGAVNFFDEKANKGVILYPLHPSDDEKEVKQKLIYALRINKVRPEMFSSINIEEINKILKPVRNK